MNEEKIYIGARVSKDLYSKVFKMAESERRSIANFITKLVIEEWERRHDDRTV